MNITKRTCTTCTAFNPAPTGEEPTCWNLVSFIERANTPQAVTREPGHQDHCDDHLTHQEDERETELVETHRAAEGFAGAVKALNSTAATRALLSRAMGARG